MAHTTSPSDVAEDAVAAGEPVAVPNLSGIADGVAATLLQGSAVAKASVSLSAEFVRIALGRSDICPEHSDWRFKDATWSENLVYKRVAQSYLASCRAVDTVLDEVDASGNRRRAERARFAMNVLTSAMSPTNTLLGNPSALKKTFESGGANLARGMRHFVSDLRRNGGMPSLAKPGVLKVGEDLALTPGQVIDRDEYAELLQYAPTTAEVFERPVLVVPPPIGRFYFLDLRPGRSLVEYAVSRGFQTFMISWRNPQTEQADWDIDAYAQRVLDAVDAVREATGADAINIIGFCAGGILQTAVLNKLAAAGDDRVHSASYAVTMLDFGQSAPIGAFASAKLLSLVRWKARKAGVTRAKAMASAFSWMRPNDLVWNYWVNNYLMGEDPPVFDVLSWNADGTNLPARLHQQFLDMFEHNPLPTPGALEALGEPIDLGTIKLPTYVVGAINDHLTPWKSTYRTTQLLSGDTTFVLSNAGHIASLVNPPGNPKASYYTGAHHKDLSPTRWLEAAEQQTGSWWENWADWLGERSGPKVPAPKELGGGRFTPQADAPGTYVRQAN